MVSPAHSDIISRELFLATLLPSARRLPTVMHRFALRAEEVILDAGGVLYRIGEPSEHFFFVVSGQMTLSRPGAADSTFREREVLGTLDAILSVPHTHTAVAATATRVLRIRVSDWAETLEDDFEMSAHVIGRVSERVLGLRQRPPPFGGFDEPPPRRSARRSELQVVDRILHLRAVPTFARASTQALAALAQLGSTTFAGEGEVMFEPNETRGHLVVIASGEVTMAWSGSPVAPRFGEGSLLAGSASLCNHPMSEVRALSAARAIVLPREDFFDVMEEHFDLVLSTLTALFAERDTLLDRGDQGVYEDP